MPPSLRLAGMIVAASLLMILASGCASSSGGSAASPAPRAASPAPPAASSAPASGISVQQVPMTPYMRSQVGTPNELSPLAPSRATNVRKVGGQWLCDINGQVYVFDGASTWVPRP
jgi:hypothetical protein